MAAPIDESILNALRGVTSANTRLPKPLLIKIYVASLKQEFNQERRMLLELVGPELQTLYDDRQIELEIVDMQFGTGSLDVTPIERDPYILEDFLHEIDTCHAHSKSVFFLALIGDGIGRSPLPTHIDKDIYAALLAEPQATGDEKAIMERWYNQKDPAAPAGQYVLKQDYRSLHAEIWLSESSQLRDTLDKCLQRLLTTSASCPNATDIQRRVQLLRRTQIEMEVQRAMAHSNEKILAVFRERAAAASKGRNVEAAERLRKIKDELTMNLSTDNHTTLVVPGSASSEAIDPDNEDHEAYLSKFKNKVTDKLRLLIEAHITNDPDVIKGRKKTVQEIFHEHATHLRMQREHADSVVLIESRVPQKLRQNLMANFRNGSRHAPYFIFGGHGSGKSAIISHLYGQVGSWFSSSTRVHRVIRFAKATPRSAYNLELLRVICQQISIIFNIPEGYLPKDASFDPLYISNWFQNLLRRIEDMNNDVLFLFVDDLHLLNPLDCDIVAALSWLPTSLPWNVQIICSSTVPVEQLRFTPMQRDRFKSAEYQFDLNVAGNETKLKRPAECSADVNFVSYVQQQFDELEQSYGRQSVGSLAAYITCSEYGLTETELLELLMPTDDPESLIDTHCGHFSFASFKKIHRQMDKRLLLHDKIMSGKVLIQWRHNYCAELAKRRYMDVQRTRSLHMELANIFFPQDDDDSTLENDDSTRSETKSVISLKEPHKDREREKDNVSAGRKSSSTHHNDDTSTFYNPIAADVSYSMRHVEESWHHLMRSDDTTRFKQIAVCNFDFLLAAVQTVSISYLRCLIEHVRCYILDRDIELIYYTIRKSSDVLTRDPMQLGSQLISWLRPISEHDDDDNSLLSMTVRSATAWCDGYAVPLLVPLTGWLPAPLPSQIRTMTVTGTGVIRAVCLAPSRQHLILATNSGDVQLWHIMGNSLEHTYKGHTAAVTCLLVAPQESQLLLTGSEDTSVMVWHVSLRERRANINAHTAAITGVAAGVNNTLIISSSEDATIAITDLANGKLVHRISYHRGPVSGIVVAGACDVLISASHDKSICVWDLENYALLNTMQMTSPVLRIDISLNSVFLLALCEDNALYVRTLATGKELHTLKGHKSRIRTISIAKDSQRCVVGCEDTRALIYDMHSGKLVRSMPPNPGPVTAVYAIDNDDFLITVGGNKITFYSFRNEELYVHPYSRHPRRKRSLKRHNQAQRSPSTTLPPITCFDLSRDSQQLAIASGRSVHLMRINTPEYQSSLEGHTLVVNCLKFAPNGEFIVTGGEDRLVQVWSMALGEINHTFKVHAAPVVQLLVLMDSLRVISSDRESMLLVWMADSGNLLQTIQGPYKCLAATNNMRFAISSNGDNTLKIWSLTQEDEKFSVSHSDEITCFEISADSMHIITGSRDMSLKVWQSVGGKLSQVLVGHSDAVTCVAVSVTNKTQVISGSKDMNLIIWDLLTGEEVHTLAGHLGAVIGVKVSADGSTAVSGSDDKTLIVWETKRGLALTSLQMHVPFTHFDISLEVSRVLVQLVDSYNLPVICLHNTPAQYVKLPTYSGPSKDVEDLRPQGPKRQMKRLLKKEVSLDTYTWQKKYGHLTSSVMMAQVDERLKRRFSVSASMEEISKIAETKTGASQANLGPEQAALAQSQHFDQLEALWNKRSPPRRRHNAGLSRQTSLVEDRLESSDDDEYQDERAGMLSASYDHIHLLARLPGIRTLHDAWKTSSLRVSRTRTKFYVSTPPHNTSNNNSNNNHNHNNNNNTNTNDNSEANRTHNPSSSSCQLAREAPDLVRDLLPAQRPVSLRQFFHWSSLKTHLWRHKRQRNCQSLQPHFRVNVPDRMRATPIIVVENFDCQQVQRVRTALVLHPQCTQAALGHTATPSTLCPIDAEGHSKKSKHASSSSCGFFGRRWPLARAQSEPKKRSRPTEPAAVGCNDCVTQ